MKEEFPERGGLPWYIDSNGKVFTQSCAIIRALAAQHGYVADDAFKQYQVDYIFEVLHDTREKFEFFLPQFNAAFGKPAASEEEKAKSIEMHTKLLGQLENIAKDGRKYFGGEKPSAADF